MVMRLHDIDGDHEDSSDEGAGTDALHDAVAQDKESANTVDDEESGEDASDEMPLLEGMEAYLRAIGRIPLLTRDQEFALAKIKENVRALREKRLLEFRRRRLSRERRGILQELVPQIAALILEEARQRDLLLPELQEEREEGKGKKDEEAPQEQDSRTPEQRMIANADAQLEALMKSLGAADYRLRLEIEPGAPGEDPFITKILGLAESRNMRRILSVVNGVRMDQGLQEVAQALFAVTEETYALLSTDTDGENSIDAYVRQAVRESEEVRAYLGKLEKIGECPPIDADLPQLLFLRANLRLVVSIAKRFRNSRIDFWDLIGEGNLGLSRATRGYVADFDAKFGTYATWWIRQKMQRCIETQSRNIRTPSYLIDCMRKARTLEQKLGREVTAHDLVHALHMKPANANATIRAMARRETHMSQASGAGSGNKEEILLEEIVGYDAGMELSVEREEVAEKVREAVKKLPADEREVLTKRMEGHSLQEIGQNAMIGRKMTRERVRQIEKRGRQRLELLLRRCGEDLL